MLILIDVDNVISDFVATMVAYMNIKYGKQYKKEDVTVWDFVESPNIDLELSDFHQCLNEYIGMGLWDKQPVYEDASEILHKLMENHCVVYLTCRPAAALTVTTKYFQDNNLPFNSFRIVEDDQQPIGCGDIALCHGRNKGVIAKQWGADLAIDDRPSTVQDYLDQGMRIVRKEEPYNNDVEYTGNIKLLRSAPNLTGFLKIVEDLASGSWQE